MYAGARRSVRSSTVIIRQDINSGQLAGKADCLNSILYDHPDPAIVCHFGFSAYPQYSHCCFQRSDNPSTQTTRVAYQHGAALDQLETSSSVDLKDLEIEETMKDEEETTGDVMSLHIITFDHSSASDLDPKKLSHLRKYLLTTLVSLTSFSLILISTLPAPALPEIAATLRLSPVEAAMSMTIYLLATALGPLLISPLSELYGRSIILHTTNVWFLAWNLACGLAPSRGVLLTARFLAGFGAAAAYAVGTGVLGDIWTREQRGKSLSYYSVIPLIGAAMGKSLSVAVVRNN